MVLGLSIAMDMNRQMEMASFFWGSSVSLVMIYQRMAVPTTMVRIWAYLCQKVESEYEKQIVVKEPFLFGDGVKAKGV